MELRPLFSAIDAPTLELRLHLLYLFAWAYHLVTHSHLQCVPFPFAVEGTTAVPSYRFYKVKIGDSTTEKCVESTFQEVKEWFVHYSCATDTYEHSARIKTKWWTAPLEVQVIDTIWEGSCKFHDNSGQIESTSI